MHKRVMTAALSVMAASMLLVACGGEEEARPLPPASGVAGPGAAPSAPPPEASEADAGTPHLKTADCTLADALGNCLCSNEDRNDDDGDGRTDDLDDCESFVQEGDETASDTKGASEGARNGTGTGEEGGGKSEG